MQNKYLSVIVFTVIFAVSVAATVGAGIIDKKIDNTDIQQVESSSSQDSASGETQDDNETIVPDSTNISNSHTGNNFQNILNQILNSESRYETVFGNSNVGGKNPHETDVIIELDGETATMVFETETTTAEDETTLSPETTAKVPTTKPDTTVPATTVTTTAPTPVTTVAVSTTVSPETTVVSTTVEDTTTVDEETSTPSDSEESDVSTEPIDNSQAEVTE